MAEPQRTPREALAGRTRAWHCLLCRQAAGTEQCALGVGTLYATQILYVGALCRACKEHLQRERTKEKEAGADG